MSEPVRIIYSVNGRNFHAVKLDADGRAEGRMKGSVDAPQHAMPVLEIYAQGLPLERVERIPSNIRNNY